MLQERKEGKCLKVNKGPMRVYDGEYCSRKCSLYNVDQKDSVDIDQNKKRGSPYHYISGREYLDCDQWFWQHSKLMIFIYGSNLSGYTSYRARYTYTSHNVCSKRNR